MVVHYTDICPRETQEKRLNGRLGLDGFTGGFLERPCITRYSYNTNKINGSTTFRNNGTRKQKHTLKINENSLKV